MGAADHLKWGYVGPTASGDLRDALRSLAIADGPLHWGAMMTTSKSIPPHHDDDPEILEQTLDCFDPAERRAALERLMALAAAGEICLPRPRMAVNLHVHTFYSYNAYGYSPTGFAWRARRAGLMAGGIVDFDTLDGVDEFLAAARRVGLPACAGIETRVFVDSFSARVINSPGEPGVAYYMGTGFVCTETNDEQAAFLQRLRKISADRNLAIIAKVNEVLKPVCVDYQRDVLRLTPRGNATERHICLAYARKAREVFRTESELTRFWSDKLAVDAGRLDLPDGPKLQGEIRTRLMKRGGVGYIPPDRGAFPSLDEMNRFVLSAGAIPTVAWLDGLSEGEQALDEWLGRAARTGALALAIIPDRNYTRGVRDQKLANLEAVVAKAEEFHWPIFVGTEMNSPGNKFVDDFESAELAPLVPVFLKGARIAVAHTVLQQAGGLGYVSEWARRHFPDCSRRMAFYDQVGAVLCTNPARDLGPLTSDMDPEQILKVLC